MYKGGDDWSHWRPLWTLEQVMEDIDIVSFVTVRVTTDTKFLETFFIDFFTLNLYTYSLSSVSSLVFLSRLHYHHLHFVELCLLFFS